MKTVFLLHSSFGGTVQNNIMEELKNEPQIKKINKTCSSVIIQDLWEKFWNHHKKAVKC